ncbi:hypothetical protein BH10PSE16_BH10PSE16_01050 [soil metagenome]
MSAMLPTFTQEDGRWICQSRCIYGEGVVTGTGDTKKAAYANWIAAL